jgi:hypothetical protein
MRHSFGRGRLLPMPAIGGLSLEKHFAKIGSGVDGYPDVR